MIKIPNLFVIKVGRLHSLHVKFHWRIMADYSRSAQDAMTILYLDISSIPSVNTKFF